MIRIFKTRTVTILRGYGLVSVILEFARRLRTARFWRTRTIPIPTISTIVAIMIVSIAIRISVRRTIFIGRGVVIFISPLIFYGRRHGWSWRQTVSTTRIRISRA